MKPQAIVVGAGIAGIASSIRLAQKGYQVSVYEANSYAGGKLSSFDMAGYRFDAGPSLFTMPALVEELFVLANRSPKDYFDYIKLGEICRYFWDDGTTLTATADLGVFAQEIEAKLGESAKKVKEHLADSAVKYNLTEKLFLQRSLHKLSTYFNKDSWQGYINFHRLEVFKSMNDANQARFTHQKVVQLFNRYATYNGSDPYQTPATMNIIPHLEYNLGTFFPKKGMIGITESLVKLAKDIGVEFFFDSQVSEIITAKNQVQGITLTDGEQVKADLVISNMDIVNTYKYLLPTAKAPRYILNQPKSSSALIFYWGINKNFSQLGLHNIFFSDNYKAEFEHIFKQKTIYQDPTIYVNITSKHKPDDAPADAENWFVMINTPNNTGQNWEALIKEARQNIIEKLSKNLGVNIEQCIVCESILDPCTIESKTSSAQGALYGNSSNNRFAAFLRHANFSSQYSNLYFVGGSVHPGGGIPLALLSAKIATDLIK